MQSSRMQSSRKKILTQKSRRQKKKPTIKKVNKSNSVSNLLKYPYYFTRYNFTHPYLVIIKGNTVYVYEEPESSSNKNTSTNSDISKAHHYTQHVRTFHTQHIWIGKSEECEFTTGESSNKWLSFFSTNPQKQVTYAGNSILIQINKHKFVHIGAGLEKFTFKDTIKEFWSPVESKGDIPQPLVVGKHKICFVDVEGTQEIDRNMFPADIQWCNAPLYYLGKIEGLPTELRKYK